MQFCGCCHCRFWPKTLPLRPFRPLRKIFAVPLIKPSIVYKIKASDDRLEMIVHTSRILTRWSQKISQTNVGNPENLLETTGLVAESSPDFRESDGA